MFVGREARLLDWLVSSLARRRRVRGLIQLLGIEAYEDRVGYGSVGVGERLVGLVTRARADPSEVQAELLDYISSPYRSGAALGYRNAVKILGRLETEDTSRVLLGLLTHEVPPVRAAALSELAAAGEPSTLYNALTQLSRDSAVEVRAGAADVLAFMLVPNVTGIQLGEEDRFRLAKAAARALVEDPALSVAESALEVLTWVEGFTDTVGLLSFSGWPPTSWSRSIPQRPRPRSPKGARTLRSAIEKSLTRSSARRGSGKSPSETCLTRSSTRRVSGKRDPGPDSPASA